MYNKQPKANFQRGQSKEFKKLKATQDTYSDFSFEEDENAN